MIGRLEDADEAGEMTGNDTIEVTCDWAIAEVGGRLEHLDLRCPHCGEAYGSDNACHDYGLCHPADRPCPDPLIKHGPPPIVDLGHPAQEG